MKRLYFIGMDVHSHTISACTFDRETGKIFAEVTIPARLSEVIRYVENRQEELGENCQFNLDSSLFLISRDHANLLGEPIGF